MNCPLGLTCTSHIVTLHTLSRERAHHVPVSQSLTWRRPEGLRLLCRQELRSPACDRGPLPGEMRERLLAVLKLQHGTQHLKTCPTHATRSCGCSLEQGRSPAEPGAEPGGGPGQSQTVLPPPARARRSHRWTVPPALTNAPCCQEKSSPSCSWRLAVGRWATPAWKRDCIYWTVVIQRLLVLWGWGRTQTLPILIPKSRVMQE